jgi:hypothetical protein
MERELCIFEMSDATNLVSLAHSRLLQEHLLKEYAATRARCAINLKAVPHSDDDLWSFVMLPDAQSVSTIFSFLVGSCLTFFTCPDSLYLQLVTLHAARSDPSTPRAQAVGRAVQRREREYRVVPLRSKRRSGGRSGLIGTTRSTCCVSSKASPLRRC